MWPCLWGPHFWCVLHYIAFKLSLPIHSQIIQLRLFIRSVIRLLPCPGCRYHASMYVRTHPIEHINTWQDGFAFLFNLHNDVSKRNGNTQCASITDARQLVWSQMNRWHTLATSVSESDVLSSSEFPESYQEGVFEKVWHIEMMYIVIYAAYTFSFAAGDVPPEEGAVLVDLVTSFVSIAPFMSYVTVSENGETQTLGQLTKEYISNHPVDATTKNNAIDWVFTLVNFMGSHVAPEYRIAPTSTREHQSKFMSNFAPMRVNKHIALFKTNEANVQRIQMLEQSLAEYRSSNSGSSSKLARSESKQDIVITDGATNTSDSSWIVVVIAIFLFMGSVYYAIRKYRTPRPKI